MADIVFFDTDNGDALIPVVPDATTTETHKLAAVATENEVEKGVAITDHLRPMRDTLQLVCVFTDTPHQANDDVTGSLQTIDLNLPTKSTQGQASTVQGRPQEGQIVDAPASETFAAVFMPDGPVTRTTDTWDKLKDAKARSLLCIVTTRLTTYPNMALIDAEVIRTSKDGSSITVSLSFAEVVEVETETVSDPLPPRAHTQVDRGSQNASEASPHLRSGALQISDGLFGSGATNHGLTSIFGGL